MFIDANFFERGYSESCAKETLKVINKNIMRIFPKRRACLKGSKYF